MGNKILCLFLFLLWLFGLGALAFSNAYFGQQTSPIHFDNVQCVGTEDGLLNCSYSVQHNFHHNADAGVRCDGHFPYGTKHSKTPPL